MLCGAGKYSHVTGLIRDRLHWLPVAQRIRFKLCLMMYKAMHGLAPAMDSYNTSIWTESAGCRRCTGVGYYFQPLQQCSSVHMPTYIFI